MTENRPAIRTAGLTKDYRAGEDVVRALRGVDLIVGAGEFVAIMGPSGSGKSTLMHCTAGLDAPTSGRAWIGDDEITGLDDRALTDLRRDRIGFIFQSFNLLPNLTASENITLPLDLAGNRPDQARFDAVVDAVGLRDRLDHRPAQLSGGQQQRVACARALLTEPAVVFADEPTGALDRRTSAELLAFLRSSVDGFGQAIVMVTHDPVAAAHADRVLFLADGAVVDELPSPALDDVVARLASWEPDESKEVVGA